MTWTSICRLDSLTEDRGNFARAGELQLAVFLHQGKVHVMDNRCPHAGGSLSGGYIENGCVVCPWHHWAFRLDDGQYVGSKLVRTRSYNTRVREDGIVEAEL